MIKEMKVKNEQLKIYLVEGRMYVIISKLAEALEANKADIYNAAARLGKFNVEKYVKIVPLNDASLSRPANKCIDVEGLPILFKKIERKVDAEKLKAVAEFLNVEIEGTEELNSNVVAFNPKVVKETITTIEDKNEESISLECNVIEDASLSSKLNSECNENVNPSYTLTIEEVEETSGSTDDAEDILNGILGIIKENEVLKNKVASLEKEVQNLNEEMSKFNGNPLEIESLRKENEELKEKLKESEERSSSILNKANLIKKYIQSNR